MIPAIALIGPLSVQADPSTEELPNIVIIFTDDQGYQDVGIFGAEGFQTPALDQMATEGVMFTNFYVSHAVCSASRASLLTGCYANRINIFAALDHRSMHGLHPDEVTIADALKPLGYRTALFGKWHLGHLDPFLPTRQGFDEFFGIPYSNDMWPYHPERPEDYPPLPLYEHEQVIEIIEDQTNLTTRLTERAVQFIAENKDRPFFLYLAHPMPHVPLYVSEKFAGKSERGLYGDVIMEIDWSVGEVLGALKTHGIDDKTLVIFSSDNGPWLSYGTHSGSALPLREGKGTSWEGGIRVPTIMRWPGQIPEGKTQDRMAMTIDILPTLAYLTGAQLPGHIIDGRNIWPLIRAEAGAESPHEAYFIYYNRNELQSVLAQDWKLYFPHRYQSLVPDKSVAMGGVPVSYRMVDLEKPELYHIGTDISETYNVIEAYPEIAERLMDLADLARQDMGDALSDLPGKNRRPAGEWSDLSQTTTGE